MLNWGQNMDRDFLCHSFYALWCRQLICPSSDAHTLTVPYLQLLFSSLFCELSDVFTWVLRTPSSRAPLQTAERLVEPVDYTSFTNRPGLNKRTPTNSKPFITGFGKRECFCVCNHFNLRTTSLDGGAESQTNDKMLLDACGTIAWLQDNSQE